MKNRLAAFFMQKKEVSCMGYARKDMTKTGRPKPENAVKGYQQNEYHNICRGFYIPPIVLQYNHQRK